MWKCKWSDFYQYKKKVEEENVESKYKRKCKWNDFPFYKKKGAEFCDTFSLGRVE